MITRWDAFTPEERELIRTALHRSASVEWVRRTPHSQRLSERLDDLATEITEKIEIEAQRSTA